MRAMAGTEVGETGTSGNRHLRFILETGVQLQSLKMEDLAAYFWERALTDEALVLLQSDQAGTLARDIRQRLYALRAATAAPGGMPVWVENYARISTNDGIAPLAGTLATLGAHARAIALFRQLWERSPDDSEAMRNLLNACRAAGDTETAEAALESCLRDGGIGLHDGARREFVLQLADALEHKGDIDGARAALDDALQNSPNDTRVLLRLGQLHTRAGNTAAAISAYQRLLVFEPGNTAARFALSAAYESQGRLEDALSQLKGNAAPDLSTGLAVLLLKTGQAEAAQAVVERLSPPQHIAPALSLATAFAAQGDARRARAVIHAALSRTDARLSFPLECKLIELLGPEDGLAAAQREMRRLRRFAGTGENPATLLASYLDFAAQQSVRLKLEKDFATELRELWAEGAGSIAAGVTMITAQIEAGDAAAVTPLLEQMLSREDAPDSSLQTVAEALEKKAGLRELLARVQERIAEINPLNEKNALNLVHTLHQLGRTPEARARLEQLALRAALNEDSLGPVAQAFAEIGDTERALALYAQAARGDRFARNWATLLQYARLQSQQGNFAGAKTTLRSAFTHPANRNFVEIIEWLVAAGRLEQADAEAADFQLTLPRVAALRRALFGYFEKAGQPGNALTLAENHPEIVEPALAARLRQVAIAGRTFGRTAKLLERHAAQAESPGEFSLELARLQGDWAQAEVAAGQPAAALAHLREAHERHPELFEIAGPLSAMLAAQGDRKAAMETLESFLALGKNPAEIEQARARLAKLRAGG
jgi:lipopolysaccharide biosynthesis regulator YciM